MSKIEEILALHRQAAAAEKPTYSLDLTDAASSEDGGASLIHQMATLQAAGLHGVARSSIDDRREHHEPKDQQTTIHRQRSRPHCRSLYAGLLLTYILGLEAPIVLLARVGSEIVSSVSSVLPALVDAGQRTFA